MDKRYDEEYENKDGVKYSDKGTQYKEKGTQK
jgi:hypothetical protein